MTDSRREREASILAAIRGIPPGRVASYGQVAELAGLPGRARLVGKILRDAPDGLQLPWHRVLRADGSLAFPPDSETWQRQRDRLLAEGVGFEGERVAAAHFGPCEDLDRLLWGPGPLKDRSR